MLIVIVIIGILAAALIPRLTGIRDRAKYTAVEQAVKDIKMAIFLAQNDTGKTLREITGYNCSVCLCRQSGVRKINRTKLKDPNSACVQKRKQNLRNIESAAGMTSGSLAKYDTDPRGHPYLLDENEGEHGGCGYDYFWTVGNSSEENIGYYEPFGFGVADGVREFKIPGINCNTY